jgi:outer membrane protein
MNRSPRLFLIAMALLLAGAGCSFAQEKPPLRLTVGAAVRMALRQNPQVQIANLNVAESREDQSIARSSLLPQADFQISDAATRRNLEAFIGRRIPGFPQHVGPFQTFQAGPGFSSPIFDLTLWRRWQASNQELDATRAQELTVREQTTLLVVSQYLGALRAEADVRAGHSRVELAQALSRGGRTPSLSTIAIISRLAVGSIGLLGTAQDRQPREKDQEGRAGEHARNSM